eukprot:1149302-Pelagomonas_calceolata.AAC.5
MNHFCVLACLTAKGLPATMKDFKQGSSLLGCKRTLRQEDTAHLHLLDSQGVARQDDGLQAREQLQWLNRILTPHFVPGQVQSLQGLEGCPYCEWHGLEWKRSSWSSCSAALLLTLFLAKSTVCRALFDFARPPFPNPCDACCKCQLGKKLPLSTQPFCHTFSVCTDNAAQKQSVAALKQCKNSVRPFHHSITLQLQCPEAQ